MYFALILTAIAQYRRILLQATGAWWCLSILGNVLGGLFGITARVSYFFVVIACPVGLFLLVLSICASIVHWRLLSATDQK